MSPTGDGSNRRSNVYGASSRKSWHSPDKRSNASVALAGAPSETIARSTCSTYTIDECTSASSCLDIAETPCGSAAGPGCEGQGWVACGLGNCDGTDVAMVCYFEET